MKALPFVGLLSLSLLAACGEDRSSSTHSARAMACPTNEEGAAADITLVARDTLIEPEPGVTFAAWTYEGDVPGPVLLLEPGVTKRVKLLNRSPREASLHFHGVRYDNQDDGAMGPSMVPPGCAHVYTITAQQPGVWPFHSHRDPRREMAFGLYGAVIVPFPNEVTADHEFVVFASQLGLEEGATKEDKEGRPFYMTLNGRANGRALVIERTGGSYHVTEANRPTVKVGDRVRWRVVNTSPDDAHTFHVHGHTWCQGAAPEAAGTCPAGHLPIDNETLLPAQGMTAEYIEDVAGEWMYHCHIVDHVVDGMWAEYVAKP